MLRSLKRSHASWGHSRLRLGRACMGVKTRQTNLAVAPHACALQDGQKYWASSQSAASATSPRYLKHQQDASKAPTQAEGDEGHLPIRDSLRSWIRRNEQKLPDAMPQDSFIYGSVSNDLTRSQSTGSSEMDQLRSTRGGMTDDPDGDDGNGDTEVAVVGMGPRRAGDLVELRATGSRVPLFAIYLGFFGDRNHFYAANGRWITSRGFSSMFTVSNFATAAELAPLMAAIPRAGSPEDFDELRREDKGPSREDGAGLIRRMTDFRRQAELVFQANMDTLDAARSRLSDPLQPRHLSLTEIADDLLPASVREDDAFPTFALYAAHMALSRMEIGFRPLNPSSDCRREDNLIEIFPQHYTAIIDKVAAMVRDYTDTSTKRLRPPTPAELEETALGQFILQAREAIQASRNQRDWSPHSILKPSSGVRLPEREWSQTGQEMISFLEWWASYDVFEPGSRFHNYGALILRALQVYDESVSLDQSTAWSLLQELGVISPWEIPSRYKVRFPHATMARGGGLERESPRSIEKSMRPDIAAGCRREHSQATIFCIDAPSTVVIDDGVSLERTDRPDEFWLHVHAADPASSIEPSSELCRYMELIPENIYLPGHFQAMLPSELGEGEGEGQGEDYESQSLVKQFSLKSGSPALTFSARVNEAGELLEYKVEPSRLGSVVYMDPKEVSALCNEPPSPPVPADSLTVGSPNESPSLPAATNREMVSAQDLDASSREDLLIMYRLAEALRSQRLARGAWPYFFPRPSVQVSFPPPGATPQGQGDDPVLPADPSIKVSYEPSTGCSIVSNLMVLAGQVAARWCSSRNVPIPYRRDYARAASSQQQAYDYATHNIYPLITRGIEPSASQRQELSRLTGGIEISPQPGPYFLLGLDMYAKATSPLRRFSDLLVHWQIHAALKHERDRGPGDDENLESVLPFFGPALNASLSLLQMREKMGRSVSRGIVDWILIALVRAWQFDRSNTPKLRFTVGSRFSQGFLGRLDLFGLNAVMDIERLDGCALVRDVRVGDHFDVELADVNVHSRQVLVKALNYLGPEK